MEVKKTNDLFGWRLFPRMVGEKILPILTTISLCSKSLGAFAKNKILDSFDSSCFFACDGTCIVTCQGYRNTDKVYMI